MGLKRLTALLTLLLCTALSTKTVSAEKPQDDKRGTISVTGTASGNYPPDTAEIVFAVENGAVTVTQAVQTNNIISEKVIDGLKKLMRAGQGDTIKTTSYSLQPIYEYDQITRKNNFKEYKIINQITLKTKQISNAGKFIDSAIEEGANRVDNIIFSLSKSGNYCKPLLQEAAESAKSEAETVARSLGADIAGIKEVSSSCGTEMPRPVYQLGMARNEAMAVKSQASVESGAITLNATVKVMFYLNSP